MIEETELPWLYKVKHELPAYIFVLDQLPLNEQYQEFIPFMTRKRIEEAKTQIQKIAEKAKKNEYYKFLLLCLSKLQSDFYDEEIKVPLFSDTKEMAQDVFPNASKEMKEEGKIEGETEGTKKALTEVFKGKFGTSRE